MSAPSAAGFGAAADARYRRTDRLRTAVPAVLRTPPRWLTFENIFQIDARTVRRMTVLPPAGVLCADRLEPPAQVVLTRLVERGRRDDTARPATTPMPVAIAGGERAVGGPRPIAIPAARPVAMVLARGAAAPPGPAPTISPAASPWAAQSRGASGPAHDAGSGISTLDVTRLTERVVAAIDRRMIAARERLGG
jgi:hypothetical protein